MARSSYKLMKQNIDNIIISDEEKKNHKKCKSCSRCKCEFDEEKKK